MKYSVQAQASVDVVVIVDVDSEDEIEEAVHDACEGIIFRNEVEYVDRGRSVECLSSVSIPEYSEED